MHGGSIAGCRSANGAVQVSGAVVEESGYKKSMLYVYDATVISDNTKYSVATARNVYLENSAKPIGVCEALREGTRIGVTHALGDMVAISDGWSTHNPDADPVDVFFSDVAKNDSTGNALCIGLQNGEAAILQHEHDWSLSVDPDDPSIAVAKCANEGCSFGKDAHTVTLNAEDADYDGERHAATIAFGDEWLPGYNDSASVPVTAYTGDIKYYSGEDWTHTAPEYPGEYVARLNVDLRETSQWQVEKTVTIEKPFAIRSVPLAVTATPAAGLVYSGEPQQLVSFSGEQWGNPVSGVYYKVDDATEYTYLTASPAQPGFYDTPPMATEAGTHTVSYYYVYNESIYTGVGTAEEPNTVEVAIDPAGEPAFMKQSLVLSGQVGLTAYLYLPEGAGVD